MSSKFFASALLFVSCAAQLSADPLVFFASLDGPSESPPNASAGTGTALVTIDATLHTMRVVASFQDLTTGNTAAHIHVINGPGDSNTSDTLGPVATATPTFPGFPSGTTAGTYDATFDMTQSSSYRSGWINDSGGTTALAEAALFAGIIDGRAYFNIHSPTYPGGEIRGFLTLVPEPATFAALGIGALALKLRRRRKK
jgi:hypothetical protein